MLCNVIFVSLPPYSLYRFYKNPPTFFLFSLSRLNFKVRCCSVWPELRWKLKKATGVRAEECNVDPPPVFQQGKTNQTTTDANEGRPTERRKNIVFLIFIRGIGYSSPESSSSDIICAAGQTQYQTDDCDSLKTQISSSNHKHSLFISSYCNITTHYKLYINLLWHCSKLKLFIAVVNSLSVISLSHNIISVVDK